MIDCQYYSPRTKDGGTCGLGMYAGTPSHGICKICLERNQNNPEYAKSIVERYNRTHPPDKRGTLKGCCGSALNE